MITIYNKGEINEVKDRNNKEKPIKPRSVSLKSSIKLKNL